MNWLRSVWSGIVSLWKWIVWAVDWVLLFYLRVTNPKYVVAVFLLGNAGFSLAALTFAGSWNDFYTVSGYWITLTGFLVAISELYRARTSADQVREALAQEIRQQRGRFYRFCLERAKAALLAAQAHVGNYDWSLAIVRLDDLIEYFSNVNSISPAADDRWVTLSTAVQGWIVSVGAGYNGRRLEHDRIAWQDLVAVARGHLNNELAPFQFGEGG